MGDKGGEGAGDGENVAVEVEYKVKELPTLTNFAPSELHYNVLHSSRTVDFDGLGPRTQRRTLFHSVCRYASWGGMEYSRCWWFEHVVRRWAIG